MKLRVIRRTFPDDEVRYIIQKRHLFFFWVDAYKFFGYEFLEPNYVDFRIADNHAVTIMNKKKDDIIKVYEN